MSDLPGARLLTLLAIISEPVKAKLVRRIYYRWSCGYLRTSPKKHKAKKLPNNRND
jgi:hypothetical protein